MALNTVKKREKLERRREPYWEVLANGCHLGFRPSTVNGGGTWIAKYRDPETGKRALKSLGDYGHLNPSERFSAAAKDARAWFKHIASGGTNEALTVGQICKRYAEERPDAAARFKRFVFADPLARVRLSKLNKGHIADWRKRLEASPALVSRSTKGRKVTRPRSQATINRDMVALRAALNQAFAHGQIESDMPWRAALKPKKVSTRRNLYLTKDQRRALIDALPEDVAAFCRGLCLLPFRPGALASLTVASLNTKTQELQIDRDKAGQGRKILLPDETARFLKTLARSKLPGACIFTRADGKPWDKDAWKKPIKTAANQAGLPEATTAYTLRHSTITDLVTTGLDLLTVAQVSGTSVAMIERHYGHLKRDQATKALEGLAL